ncbi:MAG: methyltransferase domain-containing protein [Deltaproteobacteria bacterium]|nr:methyltransferase domain-containing protein [Deltaproteobacteria bacterium]
MFTKVVCPWWFAYTFDNFLRRLIHDPARLLGSYVAPGQTVVDVGCGMGHFSLGLAGLVGRNGRVISIDLQDKMLATVGRRAEQAGWSDLIQRRKCRSDDLMVSDLKGLADFILAFWMAHEIPDIGRFMRQIKETLKPAGRFLLAEPKIHVSMPEFQEEVQAAVKVGFTLEAQPTVALSRAALFQS